MEVGVSAAELRRKKQNLNDFEEGVTVNIKKNLTKLNTAAELNLNKTLDEMISSLQNQTKGMYCKPFDSLFGK